MPRAAPHPHIGRGDAKRARARDGPRPRDEGGAELRELRAPHLHSSIRQTPRGGRCPHPRWKATCRAGHPLSLPSRAPRCADAPGDRTSSIERSRPSGIWPADPSTSGSRGDPGSSLSLPARPRARGTEPATNRSRHTLDTFCSDPKQVVRVAPRHTRVLPAHRPIPAATRARRRESGRPADPARPNLAPVPEPRRGRGKCLVRPGRLGVDLPEFQQTRFAAAPSARPPDTSTHRLQAPAVAPALACPQPMPEPYAETP